MKKPRNEFNNVAGGDSVPLICSTASKKHETHLITMESGFQVKVSGVATAIENLFKVGYDQARRHNNETNPRIKSIERVTE